MLPRPAPGFIPVSLRKMTKGEGAMASDILGYKGKRVVVMGCFSGTGEACARALVDLGAEVHGADIKPSPVNLASFTEVDLKNPDRSEEHTSELQSLMRTSYAVFCL